MHEEAEATRRSTKQEIIFITTQTNLMTWQYDTRVIKKES